MEAFLVSLSTVAIAEMGDRTQLLTLVLAARYRRPWPIVAGIFVATVANHAVAAAIGAWTGRFLSPWLLDAVVGVSMLAMALWALKPDAEDDSGGKSGTNAFVTTLVSFFMAEIGDKTQIATLALAAGYGNVLAVVCGTVTGMMLANGPVVFLGNAFSGRLPMKTIHYAATALFVVLGLVFIARAIVHGVG